MQALVLSGGGSRGAYQAGCWKALHESGYRPDLLVGTSAGAINATMIAAGLGPDDMTRWWGRLRTKDLIRLRRDYWRLASWTGLHDAARLRKLITANLDVAAVRASGVRLLFTAVDLLRSEEVVFDGRAFEIDHLMASMALLPGLPPVQIGERLLADGGHWNAFPLHVALEAGASEIVGLLHDPLQAHAEPAPMRMTALLRRLSDLAWHAQQRNSLETLTMRTRLSPEDFDWLPPFTLTLHYPEPALNNMLLAFDPAVAKRLADLGYEQTRRRLGSA